MRYCKALKKLLAHKNKLVFKSLDFRGSKYVICCTSYQSPKTAFFAASLIKTRFFCVIMDPYVLTCKFCILDYANIRDA